MKLLHILWLLICLTGTFPTLYAQQQVLPWDDSTCSTRGECLIKFKLGTNRATIDSLGTIKRFSILEYYPDGKFYRIRIPAEMKVQAYISSLISNSEVECAQPDYFISFFTSSHDQIFPPQWYNGSPENGGSNFDAALKVTGAISFSDLTVGVINDGQIPDTFWDHFKGVRIITSKISRHNGVNCISSLIESIWHCLNNGAQIITIDAGAPDSPLLKDVVEQAFNRGTTLICAAADSTAKAKTYVYPAAYNQYCIAVAAHGYQGSQVQNTAAGDYIDLSAPAEIPLPNNSKSANVALCGSSVASLYVTATAIMLSGIGINSYDKIRQALEQSCFDPPPKGWDRISGWGFLDALKAVQYFPKPDHDIMISGFKVPQWCIRSEQLQSIIAVKNQGNYIHDVTLTLTDKSNSKTLSTTTATIKPDQTNQFVFQWNTEQEQTGPHLLSVEALISGDEDLADNTQYKQVTIVKDTRDVEISGVECSSTSNEHSFNSVVQVWNKGTYTDMITIKVQTLTGTVLGQKSISMQPQSLLSIPVQCTLADLNKENFIKVTVETSDVQNADVHLNSFICPLAFP
jgi:hypothetical protein